MLMQNVERKFKGWIKRKKKIKKKIKSYVPFDNRQHNPAGVE